MNKIIEAIGEIDNELIEEALAYKGRRPALIRKPVWVKGLAAAAVAAVGILSATSVAEEFIAQKKIVLTMNNSIELSSEQICDDADYGRYYPQYIPAQFVLCDSIMKDPENSGYLLWAEYADRTSQQPAYLHIMLLSKEIFLKNAQEDPSMKLNEMRYYNFGEDVITEIYLDCGSYVIGFDIWGDHAEDPEFLKMICSSGYFEEEPQQEECNQ